MPPSRSHFPRRLVVTAFLLAAGCSSSSGPDGTGLPLGAARVQPDIAYCGSADPAQRLDLYFPKRPVRTPTPVALHIHGGAWIRGDKATGPWFLRPGEALVERGYVVASANYRLAPAQPWPAQIQDVACAMRHLRDNAARYGIDASRIGVWGNSAGGHLAAVLGVTDDFSGEGTSTRPQAVVALYGIFDLTATDLPLITALAVEETFGTRPDPASAVLRAASPVSHVSTDDSPFLLIHGREDLVVPPNQSEAFSARLAQGGVPVDLVLVERAGHELVQEGGPIRPSEEEITQRIVAFFDGRLLR